MWMVFGPVLTDLASAPEAEITKSYSLRSILGKVKALKTGIFKILAALCILGEFVAIGIPDTGGVKSKIHNASAYGVGFLLPIVVLLIASSSNVSVLAKYICWVAFMGLLTLSYLFFINRKTHNNFLYYQSAYYACFHIAILSAVYIY